MQNLHVILHSESSHRSTALHIFFGSSPSSVEVRCDWSPLPKLQNTEFLAGSSQCPMDSNHLGSVLIEFSAQRYCSTLWSKLVDEISCYSGQDCVLHIQAQKLVFVTPCLFMNHLVVGWLQHARFNLRSQLKFAFQQSRQAIIRKFRNWTLLSLARGRRTSTFWTSKLTCLHSATPVARYASTYIRRLMLVLPQLTFFIKNLHTLLLCRSHLPLQHHRIVSHL